MQHPKVKSQLSIADTMEDNHRNAKNSLSYQLYLLREELRRRSRDKLRFAKVKMQLTTKLLDRFAAHIFECKEIELKHIDHQLKYEAKLQKKIRDMKKQQHEKKQKTRAAAEARLRRARMANV